MLILPAFGHLKQRSPAVSNASCVNMYPTKTVGGKQPLVLMPTSGCKPHATTATGEGRGMMRWGNDLYFVVGSTVYKDTGFKGTATAIGTVSSSTGRVWMIYNANDQMLLTAGGFGYLYDRSTGAFAKVASADFPPDATSCAFLNQTAVVTYGSLGLLAYSGVNDFSSWNSLNIFAAESNPDRTVAVIGDHQELVVFGEETIEFFYDSGDTDTPYVRRDNSIQEVGTWSADSMARVNDLIFWVDDKLQPRALGGYESVIIGSDEIIDELSNSADENTLGTAFVEHGHAFYSLTLADKTLVYDHTSSTKLGAPIWHKRSSYPAQSRWRVNHTAMYRGSVYGLDYANGTVYELDKNYYFDNGETIRKEFSFNLVHTDFRSRIFHQELEVEFEPGVGLPSGQGSDPQAMMQYSDNGGRTYSSERWRSMGKLGEYTLRARWIGLGHSRNREYKVTVSDPVKTVVIGGHLSVGVGNG